MSAPIRYAELARALGVEAGQAGLLQRRPARGAAGCGRPRAWCWTRRTGTPTPPAPSSPTRSCRPRWLPACRRTAPRYPAGADGLVKLSAAWLIDQAGFGKGFGLEPDSVSGGRASLSTKHTLAITNRGGASAEDMLAIAREVRRRRRRTLWHRAAPGAAADRLRAVAADPGGTRAGAVVGAAAAKPPRRTRRRVRATRTPVGGQDRSRV